MIRKLILEYLAQGIEINFRLCTPGLIKVTLIKYDHPKKTQNSKVFSFEQFKHKHTVYTMLEHARVELDNYITECNQHHKDEPPEVKWKCVFCQRDGCPFGECLMQMDK